MAAAIRNLAGAVLIAFATLSPSKAQAPPVHVLDLEIADGKVRGPAVAIAGGVPVVRVRQDQTVELRWKADRSVTVHLHGYDVQTHVPEGGAAAMRVHMRAAGRFPVERHEGPRHTTLLYLEVHPR